MVIKQKLKQSFSPWKYLNKHQKVNKGNHQPKAATAAAAAAVAAAAAAVAAVTDVADHRHNFV